jgi:hypothetical protein
MIRIDEIYHNVFLPAAQQRPGTALHWFDPFGSVNFNDICNLPPIDGNARLRVIFWDQEPVYQDTVSQFMDKFIPQYQGPRLLVCSERHSQDLAWAQSTYGLQSCYYFFHGWAALDWYRGYDHCLLSEPWHQRSFHHRLFCPNNIVSGKRQHRVRLLSQMLQHDLVRGNLISFPKKCPYSGESAQDLAQTLGLSLPVQLPLIIDRDQDHASDSHRIDFWPAAMKSFCHVVTETVWDDHRVHLTEKIFKPIVLQQPFVLVGPRRALEYLRAYGFRTFDSVWDEHYDTLPDNQRMSAIVDVLDSINRWNDAELQHAQDQVWEIVSHNHKWFYGGFQDLLWQEMLTMLRTWP